MISCSASSARLCCSFSVSGSFESVVTGKCGLKVLEGNSSSCATAADAAVAAAGVAAAANGVEMCTLADLLRVNSIKVFREKPDKCLILFGFCLTFLYSC